MTTKSRIRPAGRGWQLTRALLLVGLVALVSFFSLRPESSRAVPPAPLIVTEVNPDTSTVPQPSNADSGGRTNGLAVSPSDPNIAYAATEWGGIYRTTNGGGTWERLGGHRANATWDVAVDPRASCGDTIDNGGDGAADLGDDDCVDATGNEDGGVSRIVYATSFYDGRVDDATHDSDAGINVSFDGGSTWVHPSVPATAGACSPSPAFPGDGASAGWAEPSAFGISVRQDVGRKVFIGTKCGVAISLNSGASWTHVDPFPAAPGGRVWDVVVHGSGIIDICGDEGHFRSLDDGVTWVDRDSASGDFLLVTSSVGKCSIAASPLDPDVLFATVSSTTGGGLFQSLNGGISWQRVTPPLSSRIPFVVTNVTDTAPESGVDCNEKDSSNPTTDPSPPLNDDASAADTVINDGCPAVGTAKEDNAQCGNNLDDDGDNSVNDGCPGDASPESGADCGDDVDDDLNGGVNEGCPAVSGPAPEVLNTCTNATDDDDLDGKINDGCPIQSLPEFGQACTLLAVGFGDGFDDDGDGIVDDGCGAAGTGPNDPADAGETLCDDAVDNDHDGFINDGCFLPSGHNNTSVFSGTNSEGTDSNGNFNQCDDDIDSDADGGNISANINDGCPRLSFELYVGDGFTLHRVPCANPVSGHVLCAETGVQCGVEATDNDGDGTINDGCPAVGAREASCNDGLDNDASGADGAVDDGCSVLSSGAVVDAGAHADSGDVEFNPASATPRCALFYSNDGGVYKSAACADGAEFGPECTNAVDDDDDNNDGITNGDNDLNNDGTVDAAPDAINDGCPPAAGAAEDSCDDALDNEFGGGDGSINDGCLWNRSMQGIHAMWLWGMDGASQCENAADDDGDTKVNDGCRQIGLASESAADCDDSVDDDAADDDGAAAVNDGCPQVGAEESIDIYGGMQDTGLWFSRDGGANWGNPACCDSFDVVSDSSQVVYSFCCVSRQLPQPGIPASEVRRAPSSNPTSTTSMALPQSGWVVAFEQQDGIDTFGANSYVMVTGTRSRASGEAPGGRGNGGVFVTTNNGGPATETGGGANSCDDLADNNGDTTADFGLDFSNPHDGDFLDPGDFPSDPSCSSGWTQIGSDGAAANPPSPCGVQVAMSGATPTFYVLTHECSGAVDNDRDGQLNEDPAGGGDNDGDCVGAAPVPPSVFCGTSGGVDEDPGAQLWKYTGTAPGGPWSRVDQDGVGTDLTSVGVFGVHPKNPTRLYVADVTPTGFDIRSSTDGGSNWSDDNTVEGLLGDNVFVEERPDSGPLDFITLGAYPQPSLLEFSPHAIGNENVILAGGRDSGLYISMANGDSWQKVAITPRCEDTVNNDGVTLVDNDGDGTADDGCPGGPPADGTPERDEDIPRPWHAYFDSSGIFYVGTEGRGVWKVTGLGPSAVTVTTEAKDCVIDGFDAIIASLARLAPDGESAGAHLSDLDQVLKLLSVSLAGGSGLNLGTVMNAIDPGSAASLQDFVDKLERHVSEGGVSGNIEGVDVLINAGFDITGGEDITLDVDLTLSKTVDAPLDLAAGGDTAGITVDGTAPVLLTLNASFKFGFDAPNFVPGDPTSCDSTFFIEHANLMFGAQTTVRDLLVEGNLGFVKLTTDDDFDTPGEPDEGADIDANASVKVALLDPDSSCNDGIDNAPDGTADSADADCHTDGNAAEAATYDETRAEDGVRNKITTQEMKDTSIDELTIIKPKGHVHAEIPIRTNLFDVTAPETGADCTDTEDDDRDQLPNDGCPADGAAETACTDTADDDGDTKVNDGCPRSNPRVVFDYSLNPGNPSLELFDMGALNPFGNLSAQSFLAALRGLLDWLQSMQNTGALDTQIPFMDASIGDVVAVADRLVAALESLVEPGTDTPEFGDAEDFQLQFRTALATALGVPVEDIPEIPLDYDEVQRTLTYTLSAEDSFSTGDGEGRAPTCGDGIDNGGDGSADADDVLDCVVDEDPTDSLPGRHDRTAYEDGNCNTGGDDDGDGFANSADRHCHQDNDPDKPFIAGRMEQDTCDDGADNDGDGDADEDDAQCKAPLNLAGELDIFDGAQITTDGNTSFSAGFDLDLTFGLDLRDFPDNPTEVAGAAEDSCRNNTNDDSDAQTDALDPDCGVREAGGNLGSCADGIDNNNDGVKDDQALECKLTEGPSAGPNSCYDGLDNDNDLFKDLADGQCMLALEDRLFIKTDGPDPELQLDLQLDANDVTATALIGILEVGVTNADAQIGASEDPTVSTCSDGVSNDPAQDDDPDTGGVQSLADTADSDCHTDDDAGTPAGYSGLLAEDGFANADCSDGLDNDDDGLEIIDGYVDINNDSAVPPDTGDDGTVAGVAIIDGKADVNDDSGINEEDDGFLAGLPVLNGLVNTDGDTDEDGDIDDDGSLFTDENDPDCNVLTVDLTDGDGRITLPDLLESINSIESLLNADINAFVDGSMTVGANINGASIGSGTITASGGVTGTISVDGTEDNAGPDTCTDGLDNSDVANGPPDGNGDGQVDGADPDCSPIVGNLKIDTSGLGDLLDFNTDDPLALLIRLLEIIDGMADQMQDQEAGVLGEPIPIVGVSLVEIFSHAGELADLLKGVRVEPEGNIACVGDEDEDADGSDGAGPDGANDGCPGVPVVGTPETDWPCRSGDIVDDDQDGLFNDGCPAKGHAENSGDNPCPGGSTGACGTPGACGNDTDDDNDGLVDDGCGGPGDPPADAAEADCDDATDHDNDSFLNDGCPTARPTLRLIENQIQGLLGILSEADTSNDGGPNCAGSNDDDNDSLPNDGCPKIGATAEAGAECEDTADANEDGAPDGVNDGCPDNLVIEYKDGKDLIFHLKFGKAASTAASLNFDLTDLDPALDPDIIGLETTGNLNASIGGRLDLDFGVEINGSSLDNPGDIKVFLLDTSEMSLTGAVDANDFQVRANLGPLQVLAGNRSEVDLTDGDDECADSDDDDGDAYVNEGCPAVDIAESGLDCIDAEDDDTDTIVNDGCPTAAADAHLKMGFGLTVAEDGGTAGDGTKIYLGDLPSADFTPSVTGDTNSACVPNTNAACLSLPIFVGLDHQSACTITITVNDITFPPTSPDVTEVNGDDGNPCNFADEIAAAALNLLLLESGLEDLLGMLEDLLNGKLFGFQLPLLGNLGLGTDFVEKLRTNFTTAITSGDADAAAGSFQNAAGETARGFVEDFRDVVANQLDGAGLLMDRDGINPSDPDVNDIQIVYVCKDGTTPVPCGFGPEEGAECTEAPASVVDDDHDGKFNDGCPVNVVGTAEGDCTGTADDDGDGVANDGCAADGTGEADAQCDNNTDDLEDAVPDGVANDDCPVALESVAETDADCDNNTDDEDNYAAGPTVQKDNLVNDGCYFNSDPALNGFNPPPAAIQEIRFLATIGQDAATNAGIGFDLGLPGLGLRSNGAINLNYDWSIDLFFGMSKDHGFFIIAGSEDPAKPALANDCSDSSDNDTDGQTDSDDPDCVEIEIGGGVNLDGGVLCANLAFLLVTVQDKHTEGTPTPPTNNDCSSTPANLCANGVDDNGGGGIDGADPACERDAGAAFTINLNDPGPTLDGRLEFTEIVAGPDFGDLVKFDMEATVDILLAITTSVDFNADGTPEPALPQLLADLDIDWRWRLGDPDNPGDGASDPDLIEANTSPGCSNPSDDNCFDIAFNNLRLDVGTFIASTVEPVAREIQKYTEPLQPAIDVLTAPIPVLSDLAGQPITLLDLVIFLGEGDLDFLDDIVAVIDFINSFDFASGSGLIIPLGGSVGNPTDPAGGDFPLAGPELLAPLAQAKDAFQTDPEARSDLDVNKVDQIEASSGPLAGLKKLTEEAGVSFPFLEKPSDLVQLLFGKDVTLVLWEPPNLRAYFSYSQSFGPVWPVPPVFVHIGGSVTLAGHFALGMDTEGIRSFVAGGEAPDLLKGLFLGDFDKNGQDVPEFSMRGELFAGASISVLIFSAGAEGGVFLTINIDLNDPNNDGKMKFAEIIDIIQITGNPLCIFIFSGEFGAFLRVFVEVDLFFWSQRWTFTLAEIVLLSFDVECDLDPHPVLAHVDGSNVLILHMGTNAGLRNAFESIVDEEFTVKKNLATGQVDVTAFGFTQGFCCSDTITSVFAEGDDGKDKIAALPSTTLDEDGVFTCDDGIDQSDVNNGDPPNNGDNAEDGTDDTDDDCHTDGDADDTDDPSTYDATLAEDGIDACSDGVDNGSDGKADKGTKAGDPDPSLPPDEDCSGQSEEFDIPVNFDGGSDDDELVGSIVADTLKGGADKDVIQGNEGNDDIIGGAGDDELAAGAGADDIYGDDADGGDINWDSCETTTPDAPESGTDGADYIDGGIDGDRACGQGGNDNIVGGLTETEPGHVDGVDELHGGSGNDTIDGGDAADTLFGDAHNDNIIGSNGNDTIHGGDEAATAVSDLGDNLLGGPGTDHIFGDEGDDNIVGGADADPELRGGGDDDIMLGDDGQVDRGEDDPPVRVNDVVTLTPVDPEGADNMEGGLGNDWLFGQGGADVMKGEGGEEEDAAGAGTCDDGVDNGDADGADESDSDNCDGGDDDLIGGPGVDNMAGGPGFDFLLGDTGTVNHGTPPSTTRDDDSAVFGAATGEAGDSMNGNSSTDHMFGQGANDTINGGGGDDTMHGNGGEDLMNGNVGSDQMFGNADPDRMRGNEDSDTMRGGSADDRMIGGSPGAESDLTPDAGDRMFGETGADILVGDNGNISASTADVDLLNLNPIGGDDYMEGNTANDDMYGGPGRDEMHGNAGDDYMEGNNDIDVMTGDANEDDMVGGTSLEAKDEAGSPSGGGILDEGDLMTGGDAVDFMAGDNASILRPGGDNNRNTYNDAVIRTVILYDVAESGGPAVADNLSGGDNMAGNPGDDVMYGGGNGGHDVDDDGDAVIDEDPVDNADTDDDGNEDAAGVGTCDNGVSDNPAEDDEPATPGTQSLTDVKDPDCRPDVDEDAGGDVMHGNAGDDYVEGNAGADTIFGDADQDDLIGGTGRTNTSDPATAEDGRLDGGDSMYGGDSLGGVPDNDYDVIAGDNATIDRPLDGGHWQVNDFNGSVVRALVFYDVGMAGSPAAAGTSGADTQRGEKNDDLIYGQGDSDNQQGNDGDDYMEGNAGADNMQGNNGNDDMAGGTGRISQFFVTPTPGVVADPPEGRDGRLDDGETGMSGGNGFDFMIGDNGVITRKTDTDTGAWMPNTFHVCVPLSSCNGVQHNPVVLRDVQLLSGSVGGGTSGGEQNMLGDAQDDIMYGQGGGDDMHGGTEDDYMEGNHDGDDMFGDAGQDDMLGGGSDDSDIANTAEPDLLDGDDVMRGESDLLDGTTDGSGPDAMIGDNGQIIRPLGSVDEWQTLSTNGAVLRVLTLFDVENVGSPVNLSLSGDDDMYGNDNDDIMYGQGGEDDMFGGAGDDYMEGNAHSDMMFGSTGEDDMIGGTGRTKTDDSSTFIPGRTDESTNTRAVPIGPNPAVNVPLGDTMYGEDGADEMLGDNGTVFRPTSGNQWITLNYSLLADTSGEVAPRHPLGGPSSRIERDVATIDTTPGFTAGSDLMYGGNGDDQMYGQFDDTTPPASGAAETAGQCYNHADNDGDGVADDGCPAIGDEMYGENGEDAMAGDQGLFENIVLTGPTQHIAPNQPFIEDDIMIQGSLYREWHMQQIPLGGDDRMRGGNEGDWMHAGAGNDIANGDNGNDHMFGNNGDDDMWGGRHHDHLWGGRGADQLDLHPRVDESDSDPNSCKQLTPADPQEWYTFAFEATATCDGNFEHIDFIYGGWDRDAMQANVGDNGPRLGDRLIDWSGVYNLYILCPATYGEYVSTRAHSPGMTAFLHKLAEGDGAYQPGPTNSDPSGFNDIAFVHKPDIKHNSGSAYVDTPAHFNCTTDSTTIP